MQATFEGDIEFIKTDDRRQGNPSPVAYVFDLVLLFYYRWFSQIQLRDYDVSTVILSSLFQEQKHICSFSEVQ